METAILDWTELILRWTHFIVGIAWIGSSFYFVWLDLGLRKREGMPEGVSGELWLVHGGGFYLSRKYAVAPPSLPEELHWFKYEAYFTWITGFLLLALIYYWGAETYLIDRTVMDLSRGGAIAASLGMLAAGWLVYDLACRSPLGRSTAALAVLVLALSVAAAWAFSEMFGARAAFVHAGALIGSIMVGNVFFVIIPNQKKAVAAMKAGQAPDPALGIQAKQRSTHNNYLTLPVLLAMVSNHYPAIYGHEYAWAIFAATVVLGGVVRDFFNRRNAGARGRALAWQFPAAAVLVAGLIVFTAWRPDAPDLAADEDTIGAAEALAIVQARCASCHAARPADEDFDAPPAGLAFDDPGQLGVHAARILAQAVLTDVMPPGNKTGMTELERARLGRWIRAGMPED